MSKGPSLLGVRAALILLIALACGVGVAWLTYMVAPGVSAAVLAGLAAAAIALPILNQVISRQI